MILIFDASNLCTDICKTIFVILELQFCHERGLSKTPYLELFFSRWCIFSLCQKSAFTEAPFDLFWTLTMILAIFAFWKSHFLFQNLGHNHLKKRKISCLGGLLNEKQASTFDNFVYFSKSYWPSLPNTYSAMEEANFNKIRAKFKKRGEVGITWCVKLHWVWNILTVCKITWCAKITSFRWRLVHINTSSTSWRMC